MCNIAGYVGEKRAATILIEMLKRQEGFDGGVCTGITTLHNGRLYTRRIVGDVKKLLETTDALSLPGNIGIAHSRPGGTPETYGHTHPFVTYDGKIAGVTNGTLRGIKSQDVFQKYLNLLEENGYSLSSEAFIKSDGSLLTKNGGVPNPADVRTSVMHYYHTRCGMPLTAAMARTDSDDMFKDGVIELINRDTPDRLYVLRTTRPAVTLRTEDGTYIATTRFAFPEDTPGEVTQLPVMHPCEIFKDRTEVSEYKIEAPEPVAEITDYTLEEGYKRISELLLGKADAPLHFDDLEFAVFRGMKDLFPGNCPILQDARLVYDVLWRLHTEGRLKIKPILLVNGEKCPEDGEYARDARFIPGSKLRYHMWIDN